MINCVVARLSNLFLTDLMAAAGLQMLLLLCVISTWYLPYIKKGIIWGKVWY